MRLLRPEEIRHPLFARYLREWGRLWTRNHAYQLTRRRELKKLASLHKLPDNWYEERIRHAEKLKRLGRLFMGPD